MNPQRFHLPLLLALCVMLLTPVWADDEPAPGVAGAPTDGVPIESLKDKPGKDKRRGKNKLPKLEAPGAPSLPVLDEIQKLKWEMAPLGASSDDVKRISLEAIFHETLKSSISVRQAEVAIKGAESEAKEVGVINLFNLLNPADTGALKKAAEISIQAAKTHLQAVRQKALLESARKHAELTQAFLNKYLAFQAVEQGRMQLKAEQRRFEAGETNSFDVAQTQMALIDRYAKYLAGDNAYHTASMVLAGHIGASTEKALVPEGYVIQDDQVLVAPLQLIPPELSLDEVEKAARARPEVQELRLRQMILKHLVKASFGLDSKKKETELKQVELETEKAANAAGVMAEKAWLDYHLAGKNVSLARQRYEVAGRLIRQLHVSHEAGFSSSKDVLDGQVELARAKAALMGAQVAYNLSQIQLVYEMGLLSENVFARPLLTPPNVL